MHFLFWYIFSVKEENTENEGRHGRKRRLPARYSGPDMVTDLPRPIKREKLDDSIEIEDGVEDNPKEGEGEGMTDPLLDNILAEIEQQEDAIEQQNVEEEFEKEEAANEEEEERIREEEEEERLEEEEGEVEEAGDSEYVPNKHEMKEAEEGEDADTQKTVEPKPKQSRVKGMSF